MEQLLYTKGGKQRIWDDELSPLTLERLMERRKAAERDRDKELLKRVVKEEKRRGIRNTQKRNSD